MPERRPTRRAGLARRGADAATAGIVVTIVAADVDAALAGIVALNRTIANNFLSETG